MAITYSLHKINSPDFFGFSEEEYSKFKFGDGGVSAKFGEKLARGFIKDMLEKTYDGTQLVVVSSPYAYIPTATHALKNYFVYELNKWLAQHDYPVVEQTKIHRSITYSQDYGELDAEERMNLISNDAFYMDKKYLKNKVVIFIDDIRITGSHERVIRNMIKKMKIKSDYYLLYFAQLVNDSIHPNIENYLNYAYVKSIFDLDEIIRDTKFVINTRVTKYILNSDVESFKSFLANKENDFLILLHNMALGNSYHKIEDYQPNFNYLEKTLFTNQLK